MSPPCKLNFDVPVHFNSPPYHGYFLTENQAFLNVSRWPPVWYLKDHDLYQRLSSEQKKADKQTNLKRTRWWRQDLAEQSTATTNKL